jgi:hypothetical protein
MKDAITKKQLDHYVAILNNQLPNADFSVGYAYGGARLEAKNGSRDVSPRRTKRDVYEFIAAMLVALDYHNELLNGKPVTQVISFLDNT